MSKDNAYPNHELNTLIQQQRKDTSDWQNGENHSPNPNLNPAFLHADEDMPSVDRTMETEVTAKVFVADTENIEGGEVLLANGEFRVVGRIVTDAEDGFAVEWKTGRKSIEKKANYDLVVVGTATDTSKYDKRHQGPFDRGKTDSYYGNKFDPHYFETTEITSPRIKITDPNSHEYAAYKAGFEENEKNGDFKDWGSDFEDEDE